jgi:hypothetical protein
MDSQAAPEFLNSVITMPVNGLRQLLMLLQPAAVNPVALPAFNPPNVGMEMSRWINVAPLPFSL